MHWSHYAPTSGSWLNAVETFFSAMTRRRLRRGVFHSLVDRQAAINRYLAFGFNSNGRYGQGALMRERFIPHLVAADPGYTDR